MALTSGVASEELKQKAKGFCSVAGLLVGVFTFGAVHIAFFLFPLVMVYAMFRMEKRGWLPQLKDG